FLEKPLYPQVSIDKDYSETIFQQFIRGYESFIREKDISEALKKLNKLRVLCAIREGSYGLHAVNQRIEAWLQTQKLIFKKGDFYEHRPVMITRNDYSQNILNGD